MPPQDFDIDKDIRRASTLPARCIPIRSTSSCRRTGIRAQLAVGGRCARVKAPGRVSPFTLLEGCLNEPLVLTSDDSGADMPVECLHASRDNRGRRRRPRSRRCGAATMGGDIRWTGSSSRCPSSNAVGFPSEKDNLPQLALERFGPCSSAGSPLDAVRRMDRPGARARVVDAARAVHARCRDVAGILDQCELGALLRQLSRGVPHPVRPRGIGGTTRLLGLSHREIPAGEISSSESRRRESPRSICRRIIPMQRSASRHSISGSSPTSCSTSIRGDCRSTSSPRSRAGRHSSV